MHLWCQLLALLQRLVLESSLAVQGTGIQSGTGYWNPVWILWSDLWLRDLASRHLLESRRQHCFRSSVDVSPHSVLLRQQSNLVYSTDFWYNCKRLFGHLGPAPLQVCFYPKHCPVHHSFIQNHILASLVMPWHALCPDTRKVENSLVCGSCNTSCPWSSVLSPHSRTLWDKYKEVKIVKEVIFCDVSPVSMFPDKKQRIVDFGEIAHSRNLFASRQSTRWQASKLH